VARIAALGDIHENEFTVISNPVDLLHGFQAEALDHEGCFEPRAVKAADIHANSEVLGLYFKGMEHTCSSPPLFSF
jgi:hypothetical protein